MILKGIFHEFPRSNGIYSKEIFDGLIKDLSKTILRSKLKKILKKI